MIAFVGLSIGAVTGDSSQRLASSDADADLVAMADGESCER